MTTLYLDKIKELEAKLMIAEAKSGHLHEDMQRLAQRHEQAMQDLRLPHDEEVARLKKEAARLKTDHTEELSLIQQRNQQLLNDLINKFCSSPGTKTEKMVPPSSDANGNLEGRDVKSLGGSPRGLNAVTVSSGAGVLHESTVSQEDQDSLVQQLEGIAELQQQMASDEQPDKRRMDASSNSPLRSFKVPGEQNPEAGSERSWTSMSSLCGSSSVVSSPTRGSSRLLAEKCQFCGKRPGTILGLKGFGLWQRSHEKRCAARAILPPDSFISETAAGA
eukprot:TRINITY_DN3691_c0_g3_i1.p1 TRINITY_DN3691_c0_g3~~TRINITY_DN3691_c0_g3_i1.p1  ORF type:complete len:277 (-),score=55.89 TRINITY_DN3691_c0_g3_i1:90-920(-)